MVKKIIFIIAAITAFFYLYEFLTKDNSWTLMICKTKLNEAECYDNDYVIPGFNSQMDCMLEGVKSFRKQGFECGKGCVSSSYGSQVCDVVCNKAGCF